MKVFFRTLALVSLSSFVVAVSKILESRKLAYLVQPCWLLKIKVKKSRDSTDKKSNKKRIRGFLNRLPGRVNDESATSHPHSDAQPMLLAA